jgi:hypothetical protein
MVDPRERKLPTWAREIIWQLRRDNDLKTSEVKDVTEENTRLRDLVAGKADNPGDADTFLVNEDTAAQIPLGKSQELLFRTRDGDFTVGLHEQTLIVEAERSLVLRPVQPYLIEIEMGYGSSV